MEHSCEYLLLAEKPSELTPQALLETGWLPELCAASPIAGP